MRIRTTAIISLIFLSLIVMTTAQLRLQAQDSTPQAQATIDAAVQGLFNGTATAQADLTQTIESAFSAAQTATAHAPLATIEVTPASVTDTSQLIVKETRALDLVAGPGATGAYLAPDGETFAYMDGREICIYTVSDQAQRCFEFELPRIDTASIQWSPDSRYLVMNENFFRDFVEPDIWIVDVVEGTLRNLTDDGIDRFRPNAEDTDQSLIDVSPRWLNSETIAFVRYTEVNTENFSAPLLYSIRIDGSGLEEMQSLEPAGYLASYVLAFSANGQYIAYNRFVMNDDEAPSGLWLLDVAQNEARPLFQTSDTSQVPRALDFSADSQALMSLDSRNYTRISEYEPEKSPLRIYPVNGDEALLIDADHYVEVAGWSPDGSALAYIVRNPQDEDTSGLYLSNGPGESGRLILPGMFGSSTGNLQPLTWAANNTLLLASRPEQKLVIVQLGNESEP